MPSADSGYLLIDVGTGTLRVTLFSVERGILVETKDEFPIGERVNAGLLWQRLQRSIVGLIGEYRDYEVRCIGVTTLLGWVAVDADGQPVADAWTWAHQEPDVFASFSEAASASISARMGRRLTPELAALKCIALKEQSPEAYERFEHLLTIKDFINYKLAGTINTDLTHAGYSGLFSIHKGTWDPWLAEQFGLDEWRMPPLYPASSVIGGVESRAAQELGLPPRTPVINGGPDGSVAVLGGGGFEPGDAVDVLGTTDVLFTVSEFPVLDKNQSLVNNPHPLPGLWLTGGPMGMTGGTAKWFADQWRDEGKDYEALEALAAETEPGSLGLLFIPSLTGERAPNWLPQMRGTLVGLHPHHHKGHWFRALLEGNAYSVRQLLETLEVSGRRPDKIVCLGGGARSRLVLQIRADITETPIEVPKVLEASTLGTAILCGLATEDSASPTEAVSRLVLTDSIVYPRTTLRDVYDKGYKGYSKLIRAMEHFYAENIN